MIYHYLPTIKFNDSSTDEDDWYIHVNSSNFYILPDRGATGGDNPIDDATNHWDSPYGLQLNSNTNVAHVFGNEVITTANLDDNLDDLADSRRVAHGDWNATYSKANASTLSFDKATHLSKLASSTDSTLGCIYKAKKVEPTVKKYRITVRAKSSQAATNGFYIGLWATDSVSMQNDADPTSLVNLKTHVGASALNNAGDANFQAHQENVLPPQEIALSINNGTKWLRDNGSISTDIQTFSYEYEVGENEQWFSIFLLNWSSMGVSDLYFDPLVDIEPIVEVPESGTTYTDTSHTNTAIDGENFYIDTDISGILTQGTYELNAKLNPNISGSTGYCDFVYGKIIISNGYDSASNDKYIKHVNYVRENPQPRDLHETGTSSELNHDITCVLVSGGQEYESLPGAAGNWQTSTLRIKFNSRAHYFAKEYVNSGGVTSNFSGYFEMNLRKII